MVGGAIVEGAVGNAQKGGCAAIALISGDVFFKVVSWLAARKRKTLALACYTNRAVLLSLPTAVAMHVNLAVK